MKQIFLISFLLIGLFTYAQGDKVYRAQVLLSEKKISQAQKCIDSAVVHADFKGLADAWTVRAYIYFEMYKTTDRNALQSQVRDTIVKSLKTSYALKPSEELKSNNNKLANNLAVNYYNISKTYLQDSVDYELSSIAFLKFKELIKLSDPSYDLKTKEIDFYLTVGYIFSDKFNKDNSDTKSLEIAKVALLKVLDIQPDEQGANMNMGLMYLNNAINIFQKADDISNLNELDVLQDNSIKLAKQAEQFLLKVYQKDNSNKKAVEALYYDYRLLNNFDKQEEFKNKCIALGIKVSQ